MLRPTDHAPGEAEHAASAPSGQATPALEACGLGKRYGKNWVLRDADLTLRSGQVLALLGENGAGKSTLVKIFSGAVSPDTGSVSIGGDLVPPGRPDLARQSGLAIVYQELSVCLDLSIQENIMLGRERSWLGKLDHAAEYRLVADVLTRLGHEDLQPQRLLASLSIGQRQVVEIARALVDRARVLVLDEPTSSLAAADVAKLFETVRRLSSQGLSVIYISHFLEEVRQICDSYLVLRDGRVAGQGPLDRVGQREIVELMVGRSVDELFPQIDHTPGETWLTLKDVSGGVLPRSVSLQVRRGEIMGLAGLVGAGRTETLRVIAGLAPRRSGEITAGGTVLGGTAGQRIRRGIAMLSEDRKHEGLAQIMSIADNTVLSRLGPFSRGGWLHRGRRDGAVRHLMAALQIKATGPDQSVATLSGGNQQKVAIARVLHQQATCLLFDEPTRGVDVGTKAEIYRLMGQAAAENRAVVFVSSYFRELLEMCDTIAVMARGRIVAVRPAAEWTEHELLLAAMGTATAPTETLDHSDRVAPTS
jgi:ribose transport system ATP-binding protein